MSDGKAVKVNYKLKDYEFQCEDCDLVHTKSSYCIAQQTMGHELTFTCTCGHKIEL